MMTRTLIKNAKIINEMAVLEADVLIKDDKISKVGSDIAARETDIVIDAKGKYLLPGMIDSQVHFREPGMPNKGKFITESAAAVAGGITSVMDMPNTSPQTITETAIIDKHNLIKGKSHCNYGFYLGATNDNIADIKSINTSLICGIKVFMGASTGNMLVDNEKTLEQIFKHAQTLVATHCEYSPMIDINEKLARKQYGKDVPISQHPIIRSREACIKSTEIAMKLAKKHQAKLHVLHISTAEEVALFKQLPLAQKLITAEACVHFTWFDDHDYQRLGALIKCNPAIKQYSDKMAIIDGINYGNLDIIATDHAPHTWDEKHNKYFTAPSGLPLVQTALASLLTQVNEGKFTLEKIVQKTTHNVAELFKVKKRGYIKEGYYADLVLVDMHKPNKVSSKEMLYQCGWTPYAESEFSASIEKTWVNGELKWSDGKLLGEPNGMGLKYHS
ncbi:Dihydroorotase [hydrothermal vent metagenome]|uniref:Dihydroorotase n=1 Tax=hydrothermal vent metagenome TaxID=652676 RepID=A0A3B0VNY1_9ZZZZ